MSDDTDGTATDETVTGVRATDETAADVPAGDEDVPAADGTAADAGPAEPGATRRTGDGDAAADETAELLPPEVMPAPPLRALALAALLAPQAMLLVVQGAAPLLLREAPLLLLALYPFQPWSLLVSSRTDPVAFVAVIVAVRTIPCWGGYYVGRWYGVKALDRLSRGRRAGRVTRVVVRLSARFGGLLLIFYPGATASVLAGANAMAMRRFVPLMLTGLLLSAVLTRVIADSASGFATSVAALVDQYAVPLGLVLLVGVVVMQLVNRRRTSR